MSNNSHIDSTILNYAYRPKVIFMNSPSTSAIIIVKKEETILTKESKMLKRPKK